MWVLRLCLIVASLFIAHTALADNAACSGDNGRQDVSCRALTEGFLLSMRGATQDQVQEAMGVRGRPIERGLHFISNYAEGSRLGSGDVNFTFDIDGRVSVVWAILDLPNDERHPEFIWNKIDFQHGCSDLPHSRMARCNN